MGVILDELTDADSGALHRWINDRELVELSGTYAPVAREQHDAWFAAVRADPQIAIFAIREDERLVGSCQLIRDPGAPDEAELRIRIGERDAQGRGLGTEALHLLLRHGHLRLGLKRIWLQVLDDNARAIAAYERVGFTRCGEAGAGVLLFDHGASWTVPSSSER